MSLGVELRRCHNGMKYEIEEVMLEGNEDNELTADVLNGLGDPKQCKMCNQSN